MKQGTIISILGVGLVLWWLTTGEKAVTSLETHMRRLQAAADPWINHEKSRSARSESRVALMMYEINERCESIMDDITQDFQNMTKEKLSDFVHTDLATLAKAGEGLRHGIDHFEQDISAGHDFVDGLYIYKTLDDLQPMKDVVKNLYDILSGARRLGKDLLRQLGMDSEEIGMVTEPLDIIIGH